MLKRLLLWLSPEVNILDQCNPMTVAIRDHPIGSVEYTNYPQEGFYSISGYRDDSTPEYPRIAIFGKLVLPTSFGYPDDACRGMIITSILNKQRTFKRDGNGRWGIGSC